MPRPSAPILSKELIYRTALGILDRTGRFTVPELAERLGVSVSSLYHHVSGRAAIVEGVRGLVAAPFAEIPPDAPWDEAVASWARSYRDAFAAHPAAIPALVAQTISDPVTLEQYDRVAGVLRGAGFGPNSVVLAITMLDNLCLGAALDVRGAVGDLGRHRARRFAIAAGVGAGVAAGWTRRSVEAGLRVGAVVHRAGDDRNAGQGSTGRPMGCGRLVAGHVTRVRVAVARSIGPGSARFVHFGIRAANAGKTMPDAATG